MTDPDDDWGDLARELGVQKPTSPPAGEAHAEPIAEAADEEPEFTEGLTDEAEAGDDTEAEGEGAEGDAAGGEDGGGEEQPGTGRKRRRRRRRRKKGGAEGGEAPDAGIADEPAPSYQAAARTPVIAPAIVTPPAAELPEADGGDEDEFAGPAPAAEEDTAGEVLRELIATWNVPSWEEIISGLHR
ncbi:MAG TPA: hypothetical protein VH092_23395 [Urbifossiella sp.]|nr:hypothetical protein [Urbifossiella sp.]